MAYATRIVLHLLSTQRQGRESMVKDVMRDGVRYVGVVGPECAIVEDITSWICLGTCDGTRATYEMLSSWHEDETLEDAIEFAESMTGDCEGFALGDRVQGVTLG